MDYRVIGNDGVVLAAEAQERCAAREAWQAEWTSNMLNATVDMTAEERHVHDEMAVEHDLVALEEAPDAAEVLRRAAAAAAAAAAAGAREYATRANRAWADAERWVTYVWVRTGRIVGGFLGVQTGWVWGWGVQQGWEIPVYHHQRMLFPPRRP